jgi:hypothetical protein
MFYVEFYKDTPVAISSASDYEERELTELDIREFASADVFSIEYPNFKIPVPRKDKITQLRREAVRKIEKRANDYQAQVVGTPDPAREQRFQYNIRASKHIIAGDATDAQTNMLQSQLDTCNAVNHPQFAGMTLLEFATYIYNYHELLYTGAGLIETTLVYGRSLVNAAETKEEIDSALDTLEEMAATKFNQLFANV